MICYKKNVIYKTFFCHFAIDTPNLYLIELVRASQLNNRAKMMKKGYFVNEAHINPIHSNCYGGRRGLIRVIWASPVISKRRKLKKIHLSI